MATYTKLNNTTALNANGSWDLANFPTGTDIAQWNSTVTGANAAALGGNLSVLGITLSITS